MPAEEKDIKPVTLASKKSEPKVVVKSVDPIEADLKAMGTDASLIRGANITVILRIGNAGSPAYREIPMKHLAREIKAKA